MDKLREESFLGRWSRLKRDNGSVVEPASDPVLQAAVATEHAEESQTQVTDADMPDLESLNDASEFSGFLSEGVSEALRRKAMKKLFHLPEFNIRDALNEYDEDYSTFIPMGDTVTYQMKQVLDRQKQNFKEAMAEDESEEFIEKNEPVGAEQVGAGDVITDSKKEQSAVPKTVISTDRTGGKSHQ